jgi:DNA-binding MarR family transcriptional regulator
MPSHLRELKASLHHQVANTTLRQLEVLRLLATHGSLAMHSLATRHGTSRSSTTELVDRLVAQGLVERRHDAHDRRKIEVALTRQAKALLVQFRHLQVASITTLADVYSDAELATLVRLLEKLAMPKSLEGLSSDSGPATGKAERPRIPGPPAAPRTRQ